MKHIKRVIAGLVLAAALAAATPAVSQAGTLGYDEAIEVAFWSSQPNTDSQTRWFLNTYCGGGNAYFLWQSADSFTWYVWGRHAGVRVTRTYATSACPGGPYIQIHHSVGVYESPSGTNQYSIFQGNPWGWVHTAPPFYP